MRRFAPGWLMTGLMAVVLPLLIGLGIWQLDRAADKRAHQTRFYERLGAPPQAAPADWRDTDFLRVRLRGQYRSGHDYLVDNRIRDGRPGYWVVTRFRADDGRTYLVNRGWIAADGRARLPEVATPRGTVELTGVVWPDLGLPPLLAGDAWSADWPKRVQRLDVRRMAAEDDGVVPREIRLEHGQPGAFDAAPVHVTLRPERHQGYAAQWFGLAVVLTGAYLVFGFRQS